MSTYYVAGLLFGAYLSKVMLIRKNRPDWMKGKLNGIGGHIEAGEEPLAAMRREFKEETGITIENWEKFALLVGNEETDPWYCHWYTTKLGKIDDHLPFPGVAIPIPGLTDEPVDWYDIGNVIHEHNGPIMHNLPWLIYMAKERIEGKSNVQRYHITEKYADPKQFPEVERFNTMWDVLGDCFKGKTP